MGYPCPRFQHVQLIYHTLHNVTLELQTFHGIFRLHNVLTDWRLHLESPDKDVESTFLRDRDRTDSDVTTGRADHCRADHCCWRVKCDVTQEPNPWSCTWLMEGLQTGIEQVHTRCPLHKSSVSTSTVDACCTSLSRGEADLEVSSPIRLKLDNMLPPWNVSPFHISSSRFCKSILRGVSKI